MGLWRWPPPRGLATWAQGGHGTVRPCGKLGSASWRKHPVPFAHELHSPSGSHPGPLPELCCGFTAVLQLFPLLLLPHIGSLLRLSPFSFKAAAIETTVVLFKLLCKAIESHTPWTDTSVCTAMFIQWLYRIIKVGKRPLRSASPLDFIYLHLLVSHVDCWFQTFAGTTSFSCLTHLLKNCLLTCHPESFVSISLLFPGLLLLLASLLAVHN